MPRYVIDSWAWIEYLNGTAKGETVRKHMLDERNEIYTNMVSLASRKGMDINFAFNAVVSSSVLSSIDEKFCREAGKFHGEMRKEIKDFGLGDAFVVIAARRLNAKILTGDPHFRNIKEAVML